MVGDCHGVREGTISVYIYMELGVISLVLQGTSMGIITIRTLMNDQSLM